MAQYLGRGMRMIVAGLAPERIVVVGDLTHSWHRFGHIIETEIHDSGARRRTSAPSGSGLRRRHGPAARHRGAGSAKTLQRVAAKPEQASVLRRPSAIVVVHNYMPSAVQAEPYRNPSLPAARRVKDLLSRMTLEEKAAQMMCVWQKKAETLVDADGNFDPGQGQGRLQTAARPRPGGASQRCRQGQGRARHGGTDQRHPEILHRKQPPRHSGDLPRGVPARPRGHRRHQLSAADRARRHVQSGTGGVAVHHDRRRSARSRGTHQALTPVVDVAREPRWGRVEETYGEDPYLVSRLGIAAVRGFQGDATFRRQAPRDRHAEALRRPRPARSRHQLRARERLHARAARDVPVSLSKRPCKKAARSA